MRIYSRIQCLRPNMSLSCFGVTSLFSYTSTLLTSCLRVSRIPRENPRRQTSETTETGRTRCRTCRTWRDVTPSPSNTGETRSRTPRTVSTPSPPEMPASVWSQVGRQPIRFHHLNLSQWHWLWLFLCSVNRRTRTGWGNTQHWGSVCGLHVCNSRGAVKHEQPGVLSFITHYYLL